jgi:tryptophan synthase alpha chain
MTLSTGPRPPEQGRIAQAFASARQRGRCCLIPYITAGDPDLARTRSIARGITTAAADLLEIGVPFSDPIADGPVNQRASERALRNGVTLRTCLDLSARLRADGAPPIVLFTYYNPIHRMGLESFAVAAAASGVDGVLVTDLPPEEADELRAALRPRGVDLIFLLSPTSSTQRVERISRNASGFIYFISRTGVTGEREDLPRGLDAQVRAARDVSRLPIAVGFGISRPEQARAIADFADGVVVGSVLVRLIEEHAAAPDLEERVVEFCRTLQASLHLRPAAGS